MSVFNKISIGVKTKRYTHHLPFDNNTTMQFGVIQPLFSQFLNAGDKLSADVRQLVRLFPMPVPTFGRMHLENVVKYVKMTDIYPAYEAFLSRQMVSTAHSSYLPQRLPFVTPQLLCIWLLRYSIYSTYKRNTDGNYVLTSLPSDISSVFDLFHSRIGDSFKSFLTCQSNPSVSPDGADYVIMSDNDTYMYCFRFTNAARRLRNILVGLGYSYDLDNTDMIECTSILAFYKAYYDTYAPSRDSSWTQTAAFRLVNFFYDYGYSRFSDLFADPTSSPITVDIKNAALKFLDDLLNCWYVEPLNFVSAHRVEAGSNNAASGYNVKQIGINNSFAVPNDWDPAEKDLPNLDTSASPDINSYAIRQLLKLSRFVTKDSVIGQKVSSWLKAHFGANVDNSIFKDSTNVTEFRVNCSINDVFSTSDTRNGDSGETLGAFAGKGLGFDNSGFEFTAPSFGYVFCLSCIVPDANFFQGYDPTLYATTPDQRPNADLDAFGYEATPLGSIMPLNDVSLDKQHAYITSNKSFGFIPRYSAFKNKKDIINGDMSRRGSINDFAPYYLDKIITSQLIQSSLVDKDTYQIIDFSNKLPLATEAWRYTCKFPWLGNYNRIFAVGNYTDSSKRLDLDSDNYYTEQIIDDLFIVQSVFDMRLTNQLKPMSDSYDTFDDDTLGDNSRIEQQAN